MISSAHTLASCSLACVLVVVVGCGDESGSGTAGGGAGAATAGGSGATGSGSSSATTTTQGPATGSSTTGQGGAGGGSTPSPGCGLADPPSGELTIDVGGVTGDYVISVPAAYDPEHPYPLGFAFHGAGRTGPQCQAGDCAGFQSVMQDDAILVYMTSIAGPSWGDDFDQNSDFFEAVLGHVLESYCIDVDRVFAAGTSSGAHFSNVVGCRFGDRLLAIAPVAGYLPQSDGCVDNVAALVIHGYADPSFPLGEEARDFWRDQNGCTAETVPTIAEVHASVLATDESYACADYQGCNPGLPVTWCEHSEGGYDGTTHGWPLVGGQLIWDFVSAL
jgi:poly(3-hydroxybutyrate) depolymerase